MQNEYIVTGIDEFPDPQKNHATPFLDEAEKLANESYPNGGYQIWRRPVGIWTPAKRVEKQ